MSASPTAIADNFSSTESLTAPSDQSQKTYPFRRFFARISDLILLGYLPGTAALFNIGHVYPKVGTYSEGQLMALSIGVIYGIGVVLCALSIALFSNTPSKAVFGIKVRSANGRIGFGDALSREIGVLVNGMCLGIPLLWLFTAWFQSSKLRNEGKTTWDKSGNYEVIHSRWVFVRPVSATVYTLICLFLFSFTNLVIESMAR